MKTIATTFDPCGLHGGHMYAVRAGVPLEHALWNAAGLLASAKVIAEQIPSAKDIDRERLGYACSEMISFALAAVESCNEALEKASRQGGDQ